MRESHRVEVLGATDVADVVSVLVESFADYPVMRFVVGDAPGYMARLETLLTYFVTARVLRDEALLGVRGDGGLQAAAMVSWPGARTSPPELDAMRDAMWDRLGADTLARYQAFGAATAPFAIEAPQLHLNMIGVRRAAQGLGLGRMVLDAVHALSESDAASTGVSLSTEVERNVPLYEHFGYEVTGSAIVASTFTTWVMFRRNR